MQANLLLVTSILLEDLRMTYQADRDGGQGERVTENIAKVELAASSIFTHIVVFLQGGRMERSVRGHKDPRSRGF